MKKIIFTKIKNDILLFFLISILSLAAIVWIIQAVNYLDLISEDGHGLKVYFLYTLYALPKIISKIFPFIFMISIFYVILKYETNNELMIYWLTGVSKFKFINYIIKISIIYYIFQMLLTLLIVPAALDKGRSYFRSSKIDLFTSIIKERKFTDTISNLTFFVNQKKDNLLNQVIIKEKINENESQTIIAQKGEVIDIDGVKKIILVNGKIISNQNNNQKIINFSEFILDLSKFSSNTITHPKTQEMNSINLLKCVMSINEIKYKNVNNYNDHIIGCDLKIKHAINEEFLKRFLTPIYIILISLISCLIVFNNKNYNNFRLNNFLIFFSGVLFIIISEITLSYSSKNYFGVISYLMVPLIFFIIIYFIILIKNKLLEGKKIVN